MDWISPRAGAIAGMRCLAALAIFASGAATGAEPAERSAVRVARLIRELGDADYSRRQAADEQLSNLGPIGRTQLEQALSSGDVEVRLRARRLLERLKLEQLWTSERIGIQARGQPASKVLLDLAARSGNHIYVGDPYGNFSEQALPADYEPVSYWEVVDDICQRTGNRVRPHYDMHTPGIVISAGPSGDYPRAYAGPLRAQITSARRVFIEELSYEEQKAELTHTFQINLQLTWEDRFRVVGYASGPQLVEAVTNEQVAVSAVQPTGGGWNATTRGLRQIAASLKLNPVPLSAKTLDVLKIKWGLIAVAEPSTLEITEFDAEQLHSQDDVAVRLEGIERQPTAKYVVTLHVMRDLAMPEPQEVVFQEYEVELFDAQGRAFRLQNCTPVLGERGVQLKVAFIGESAESEPKKLKLQYPRLRARRDVELVFRNVPLPVSKPQ
jgi:hypothetical protein